MIPFLVVQHRVISIETIYTQTIKTDFTGSIYIHLHRHIRNKYNQEKRLSTLEWEGMERVQRRGTEEARGKERGRNDIIVLNRLLNEKCKKMSNYFYAFTRILKKKRINKKRTHCSKGQVRASYMSHGTAS